MHRISREKMLYLVKAQNNVWENGEVCPVHGQQSLTLPRSTFLKLICKFKTIQSKSRWCGSVGRAEGKEQANIAHTHTHTHTHIHTRTHARWDMCDTPQTLLAAPEQGKGKNAGDWHTDHSPAGQESPSAYGELTKLQEKGNLIHSLISRNLRLPFPGALISPSSRCKGV